MAGRNRRYTNHQPKITIPYNPLIFQEKSFLFSSAKIPITSLFHKAQNYEKKLKQGTVKTQAELAQKKGISQPTISRTLILLKLAPEIKEYLTNLTDQSLIKFFTETKLRRIATIKNHQTQMKKFEGLKKMANIQEET